MRKLRTKNKSIFLIILLVSSIFLSITSLTIINTTATSDFIPTPVQPNENVYWNFDNDTIIGWRMEVYNGTRLLGLYDLIFNISATKFYRNYSGMEINYYGIELTTKYFNESTNSLETYIYNGEPLIGNYSMVNFTYGGDGDFIGIDYSAPGFLFINPFIPTNGSDGLLLDWCANRLADDYMFFLGNDPNPIINTYPSINMTRHENSTSGEYVEAIYYANGTLKTGELFTYAAGEMYPEGLKYNYTRIYDFNPLDELEWAVDVGDILYSGIMMDEYQIEIVDFINFTAEIMGPLPMSFQCIIGDIYKWNYTDKIWEYSSIGVIAAANELFPVIPDIPMWEGHIPLLFPNGTKMVDMLPFMSKMGFNPPEFEIDYGDYWIQITDLTSGGYQYIESFANGLTKYVVWEDMGFEFFCLYYKNSTIISGPYDFEIEPYGTDEFNVNVNISVSADTHLLFAGMHMNPTNITLNEGLLFIDLFLNDTNNLQGLVNITIMYDDAKFRYLNMWWFNMTADGGKGAWTQIPFTDLGGGTLEVLVDHVSFFALTGNSRPESFILDTNATDPDIDGIFDLYWENAIGANNYSVYESDALITSLTGSETLLASEIDVYEIPIVRLINDEYYYIISANNDAGITLSNCILVDVQIPPALPGDFTLSSNSDVPDDDGDFDLTWTLSEYAINYTVYQYSGYITQINGSVTTLSEGMTTRTLSLTGYTNGTYYFIVEAHNAQGDTLSNCHVVVVEIPPEEPSDGDGDGVIPGYPLYLLLTFFIAITAILIRKKRVKLPKF